MKNEIDIVIPWVNAEDHNWQESYLKYKPSIADEHSDVSRFRDWGLMRFWFRCIEKNMPWIRKIHFITCGHVPEWLDLTHTKLNIVKHSDYIPSEYLPVFSSHVIEIFINNIKGLSDKFIYFNDDLFPINKISETDFFRNGFPCDTFAFNVLGYENISHIIMNDIREINYSFDKFDVVKNNLKKIFNFRYPEKALRSLFLLPWPHITGFFDHHLPQAYSKSTFDKVWSAKREVLLETAKKKFRTDNDINQYLFRYWQLCCGDFESFNLYKSSKFTVIQDNNIEDVCKAISKKHYRILIINDGKVDNFCYLKEKLHQAFNKNYAELSSFEKG